MQTHVGKVRAETGLHLPGDVIGQGSPRPSTGTDALLGVRIDPPSRTPVSGPTLDPLRRGSANLLRLKCDALANSGRHLCSDRIGFSFGGIIGAADGEFRLEAKRCESSNTRNVTSRSGRKRTERGTRRLRSAIRAGFGPYGFGSSRATYLPA